METVIIDGQKLVVLGGALLHEDDHRQVLLRQKSKGMKFGEALADYVKEHGAHHPGISRVGGHLGFQSHDNRTEFKNVFVKPLD